VVHILKRNIFLYLSYFFFSKKRVKRIMNIQLPKKKREGILKKNTQYIRSGRWVKGLGKESGRERS
jgi:hypothetical protein